jgi:hypothetical protein
MIRSAVFSKVFLPFLCAMLCLSSLISSSRAADLPPSWYKNLQDFAPEALTIQVQSVTTKPIKQVWGQQIYVTVMARVEQAERTRDGLKPGQVIQIRYLHNRYTKPQNGARELPILQRNQKYPAFLEPDKKHYVPAAGGYSFEKVNAPS